MERADRLALLQDQFRDRFLMPRIGMRLSPQDAWEYIQAGKGHGLVFVGVEGYSPTPGGHRVDMEWGNDIAHSNMTQEEFEKSTYELLLKGERAGVIFEVFFDIYS